MSFEWWYFVSSSFYFMRKKTNNTKESLSIIWFETSNYKSVFVCVSSNLFHQSISFFYRFIKRLQIVIFTFVVIYSRRSEFVFLTTTDLWTIISNHVFCVQRCIYHWISSRILLTLYIWRFHICFFSIEHDCFNDQITFFFRFQKKHHYENERRIIAKMKNDNEKIIIKKEIIKNSNEFR
jgi:hypothetical protein